MSGTADPFPTLVGLLRRGGLRLVAAPALLAFAALAVPAASHAAQHAPPAAPARPAEPRPATTVVAIFGDGYAEALAEGLRLDLADQTDTTVLQATHAPSGLADASHFDWKAAIATVLAQQHVGAAVVMLGANDRAPLPDGSGEAAPLTPRWRTLYAARVQALADQFRSAGVPLIWVGLPIVADDAMSADFVALNEITRDRATAAGASYVDAWSAFANESGHYGAFGPDAKGRITRLRTSDGLDLTQAGAIKLASFVEVELRARRAAEATASSATGDVVLPDQPDFDKALDVDVNAQIRREAGLPALPGATAGKVERGPVIALTAPTLAEDGRLLGPTSAPPPLMGEGGTLAQRALVEGLPIQPKAGRADDFAWPRP